ncbi:hypothetical protein K469DRAFT_713486 [Zopfia rhizophila CBS 207.26]|uniref:Uncharacterized protein n=1 Tax=Zopfia rhizophila CBS 207.26 TaxID=1314779 RepID=A0A6A6DSR3_9PEZI|nr:hypothetical protein K469DRAFT_713486 [Zopfia rhizophila CBS 207.26]
MFLHFNKEYAPTHISLDISVYEPSSFLMSSQSCSPESSGSDNTSVFPHARSQLFPLMTKPDETGIRPSIELC